MRHKSSKQESRAYSGAPRCSYIAKVRRIWRKQKYGKYYWGQTGNQAVLLRKVGSGGEWRCDRKKRAKKIFAIFFSVEMPLLNGSRVRVRMTRFDFSAKSVSEWWTLTHLWFIYSEAEEAKGHAMKDCGEGMRLRVDSNGGYCHMMINIIMIRQDNRIQREWRNGETDVGSVKVKPWTAHVTYDIIWQWLSLKFKIRNKSAIFDVRVFCIAKLSAWKFRGIFFFKKNSRNFL
jgi:hypothetical protein